MSTITKKQIEALRAVLATATDRMTDEGSATPESVEAWECADDAVDALALASQGAAPASEGVGGDWTTPTTHLKRFGDAMELLCRGKRPDEEILTAWLDADADDSRLQNFAAEHGPAWGQGIGIIDAALTMADQPTEGVDHEYRKSPGAAPTGAGDAEPAIWVSPEQVAALQDADGDHGEYLPARKSGAGKFTMPLYAAPQQPAEAAPGEIDALRADAERYRWLRERERWASVQIDFERGGTYRQHRVCWYDGDGWPQAPGQSLDEAIDAALANNKKGGEHAD